MGSLDVDQTALLGSIAQAILFPGFLLLAIYIAITAFRFKKNYLLLILSIVQTILSGVLPLLFILNYVMSDSFMGMIVTSPLFEAFFVFTLKIHIFTAILVLLYWNFVSKNPYKRTIFYILGIAGLCYLALVSLL